MAREGMQFLDFQSSGNVCSPTRAGLMTGRYQQRAGIPGVLFANPARPSHHGIETGTWPRRSGRGLRHRRPSPNGISATAPGSTRARRVRRVPRLRQRQHRLPLAHRHGGARGLVARQLRLAPSPATPPTSVTQLALRFLDRHRGRPFFLYLPHHAPHYPFQGPGRSPGRSPRPHRGQRVRPAGLGRRPPAGLPRHGAGNGRGHR